MKNFKILLRKLKIVFIKPCSSVCTLPYSSDSEENKRNLSVRIAQIKVTPHIRVKLKFSWKRTKDRNSKRSAQSTENLSHDFQ